MNLIERVKKITLTPAAEWPVIEAEPESTASLYTNYILILAAIPAIAGFLGGWLFGYSLGPAAVIRTSFFGGLGVAVTQYLISLAMVFIVARAVSFLAPNFGGVKDDMSGLKLIAYSWTPVWIAGIFGLIPGLRFLAILGLWGLYVFYLGAKPMLKVPEDKAAVFTVVAVVATIVLGAVLSLAAHAIIPGPGGMFL